MNDRSETAVRWRRWLTVLAILALAGALVAWLLAPAAVPIESAVVSRGPLEVTVDQQGEVRMHDRYNVTAPVAGQLARVELHQGDLVAAGQVVARLAVTPLDPRAREQAEARLAAARSGIREAEASLEKSRAESAFAVRERERAEQLVERKFVSVEALERARTTEDAQRRVVRAAEARLESARSDARAAEAALMGGTGRGQVVALTAPASGRVLRLIEQSERTVPAGTVIMVIGDPAKTEIVADVLSTEAVRIAAGAPVRIVGWGGGEALAAQVRTVEPYAYTKVSALGVEEKRVDVVMDPVGPREAFARLGDGYRIEARIVVWQSGDVLRVPVSALFRCSGEWCVYVVRDRSVHLQGVQIGERSAREASVQGGLAEGDRVVLYPPNTLAEGARVRF